MAARMSHFFQQRTMTKEYLAVVVGHVVDESVSINAPVGYDETDPTSFRMKVSGANAKTATTGVKVLQRGWLAPRGTSLVKIPVTKVLLHPMTGRRHQLRVHCQSVGHPILGDATYTSTDSCAALPHVDRMMLHAWRLEVPFDLKSASEFTHHDRVESKKVRRRETLGLQEPHTDHTPLASTVFETEDPFQNIVAQ
jgi:23S rRNA-/tRNA-specific pseudouridylate synthase